MPESGRGGGGRQHIPTLIEAAKRGLGISPSFPMGSGFNQEFDNIYEKFKKEIYAKADAIETRRKLEGDDYTLTRKDLGELINGKPGDSIEEKPFDSAFSKESITSSFAKIGACPLTRNSLFNNPKLRRGADANSTDPLARGQATKTDKHAAALAECEALGVRIDAHGPARSVAREEGEETDEIWRWPLD